jgi:hypothetical protein
LPIVGTVVGIFIFALFAASYLSADETRKQSTAEAVVVLGEKKEPQAEVEELVQIRKRLGSAWRGDAIGLTDGSDADLLPPEDEVVRTALVDQARESQFTTIPPTLEPKPGWRATLRAAAHELDVTAYSLECQELYNQADELRAVAQRYRLQARGGDSFSHPRLNKPAPVEAAD